MSFKLTYLIELVRTNNLKYFIRRLTNIHRLGGCLRLSNIVKILENNNISYRKYETTDYDYYKQKGLKLDCATCDLVILEIANPNHNQHLEIEIDKVLDSVVDLWFGTYWFEYYECHNEQEFIDSYLNTIKEVMKNKMTFLVKSVCTVILCRYNDLSRGETGEVPHSYTRRACSIRRQLRRCRRPSAAQ